MFTCIMTTSGTPPARGHDHVHADPGGDSTWTWPWSRAHRPCLGLVLDLEMITRIPRMALSVLDVRYELPLALKHDLSLNKTARDKIL